MKKTEQLRRLKVLHQDLARLKLVHWSRDLSKIEKDYDLGFQQIFTIFNDAEACMQDKVRAIIADKIKDLEIELYGIKPTNEIDFEGMEMELMMELMKQGFYSSVGKNFIKIIKRYL